MKIYFSTTALEFQTQTAGQINGVNTNLTFSLKNRNFVGIYSTYAEAVRETAAELEGGWEGSAYDSVVIVTAEVSDADVVSAIWLAMAGHSMTSMRLTVEDQVGVYSRRKSASKLETQPAA